MNSEQYEIFMDLELEDIKKDFYSALVDILLEDRHNFKGFFTLHKGKIIDLDLPVQVLGYYEVYTPATRDNPPSGGNFEDINIFILGNTTINITEFCSNDFLERANQELLAKIEQE